MRNIFVLILLISFQSSFSLTCEEFFKDSRFKVVEEDGSFRGGMYFTSYGQMDLESSKAVPARGYNFNYERDINSGELGDFYGIKFVGFDSSDFYPEVEDDVLVIYSNRIPGEKRFKRKNIFPTYQDTPCFERDEAGIYLITVRGPGGSDFYNDAEAYNISSREINGEPGYSMKNDSNESEILIIPFPK